MENFETKTFSLTLPWTRRYIVAVGQGYNYRGWPIGSAQIIAAPFLIGQMNYTFHYPFRRELIQHIEHHLTGPTILLKT